MASQIRLAWHLLLTPHLGVIHTYNVEGITMSANRLTTKELAGILGIRASSIYNRINSSSAPDRVWDEGRSYFTEEAIDRWVAPGGDGERYASKWLAFKAGQHG